MSELPVEEYETIVSPDGDPEKTGTIRAAVSIGRERMFGPLDVFAPTEPADTESSLLVARRQTELVVAQSLGQGLARFYENERERRDAADAIADTEPWRHR